MTTLEIQDCLGLREKYSEARCCRQPERPSPPLSSYQYELRECFPCRYRPLNFFLVDRFPCVKWMKRYSLRWLLADVVAGLTVGLMVVPQALAYAQIAKLPTRVS